jgi:hypothetical protein
LSKVIKFPSKFKTDPVVPDSEEDGEDRLEMAKFVYFHKVTETLVETMVDQLHALGFDPLDDEHDLDFTFFLETMTSLLAKTRGIYHPFQELAVAAITEEGIPDSVNVEFSMGDVEIELECDEEQEETDTTPESE